MSTFRSAVTQLSSGELEGFSLPETYGEWWIGEGWRRIVHRLISCSMRHEDWQPEPGGVWGILPTAGQVIWSTMITPEVQSKLLHFSEED